MEHKRNICIHVPKSVNVLCILIVNMHYLCSTLQLTRTYTIITLHPQTRYHATKRYAPPMAVRGVYRRCYHLAKASNAAPYSHAGTPVGSTSSRRFPISVLCQLHGTVCCKQRWTPSVINLRKSTCYGAKKINRNPAKFGQSNV